MERLQRNFLWGRSDEVFKHHLVKWKEVCKSVQSGGAGVRQLKIHNEALLGKWFWRYAYEKNSLWNRVIASKYGEGKGGWLSAEGPSSLGISLWKSIRRNWQNFNRCITWKAGIGDRIMFWSQKWLEIGILSQVFPGIYELAADKEALISDYKIDDGINRFWNVKLRRNLNDWEMESYGLLLDLLYAAPVESSADAMIWQHSKHNIFTVKSFYHYLVGADTEDFPWKKLWTAATPTKVSFFAWCAVHGKILTLDNLKRRGYSIVNRCSLCHCQEESIDHLLIHCGWSWELWSLTLSCFGVHMSFPRNLKNFLLLWWGQSLERRKRKLWNLAPICLFWLIWRERNMRMFENTERSIWRVKSLLLSCLYSWDGGGKEINLGSFLDFITSMK